MSRHEADAGRSYFERAVYRSPLHPAVRSYTLPKIRYLQSKLPLRGKTILDVGCGNGVFTMPLTEWSSRTVGLDRSEHMLRELRSDRRVRGSAAELPFHDDSFAIAFEANVLHHTSDPLAILREMRRVATEYVVLIEPNRANPLMFLFGLLVREERGTLGSSRRRLVSLATRADLEVLSAAAMGMISQNLTPTLFVPLLRVFDRPFPLGEYLVVIARRRE